MHKSLYPEFSFATGFKLCSIIYGPGGLEKRLILMAETLGLAFKQVFKGLLTNFICSQTTFILLLKILISNHSLQLRTLYTFN